MFCITYKQTNSKYEEQLLKTDDYWVVTTGKYFSQRNFILRSEEEKQKLNIISIFITRF